MSRNISRNVDICVTCVSQKPPMLPLREELPSLGIEVVYNSDRDTSQSSGDQDSLKQGLSYEEYENKLHHLKSDKMKNKLESAAEHEDEAESVATPTSFDESQQSDPITPDHNHGDKQTKKGWGRFKPKFGLKKKQEPLIQQRSPVQPYVKQDNAVNEAFNVFADQSTIEGFSKVESSMRDSSLFTGESSSGRDNSTLTSHHPQASGDESEEQEKHQQVEVVASRDTHLELPGLKSNSNSISTRKDPDAPLGSNSEEEAPSLHSRDPDAPLGSASNDGVDKLQKQSASNSMRSDPPDSSQDGIEGNSVHHEDDTDIVTRDGDDTTIMTDVPTEQRQQQDPKSPSEASHHSRTSVKEFYDLTDILENEEEDQIQFDYDGSYGTHSPRSFGGRSFEIYPSFEVEAQVPSEEEDNEEDLNSDPAEEAEIPVSPTSFSKAIRPKKVIRAPHKRHEPIYQFEEDARDEESTTVADWEPPSKTMSDKSWMLETDTNNLDIDEDNSHNYLIQSPRKSYSIDERESSVVEVEQDTADEALERALDSFENAKASLNAQQASKDLFDYSQVESISQVSSFQDAITTPDLGHVLSDQDNTDIIFTSHEEEASLESEASIGDKEPDMDGFIDTLINEYHRASDLACILEDCPSLAEIVLDDGRMPLHLECTREFPDRFSEGATSSHTALVEELVQDVIEKKELIMTIGEYYMNACGVPTSNGDLPVHLMARNLMEWEAQWYQRVYETAQVESQETNAAAITKLYQAMSECIDFLLNPISGERDLCDLGGSTGSLLPLHISAIFTVSYGTLQNVLQSKPEAARIPCDLTGIRTFIPSGALPLQLHDRLSTDFPKWEIEAVQDHANHGDIDWTQSTLEKTYGVRNCIRRSDLFFAYNPNILPYRHDTQRILRIESIIRGEAEQFATNDDFELSPIGKQLWVWLATFAEEVEDDEEDDTYADSVRRIVKSVAHIGVKELCAVEIKEDGPAIIDAAPNECRKILRERLSKVDNNEIAIPMASFSTGFKSSYMASPYMIDWEESMAQKLCLDGQGFSGVLCRLLFGITEQSFPTSFILLPYKLVHDDQGRLGLESPSSAENAMRFADSLIDLTQPEKIVYFLEKKATRQERGSLVGANINDDEWQELEQIIHKDIQNFVDLFSEGPGYFYFLDEFKGTPIVPEHGHSIYPLEVKEPMEMVRKILPMMLTGMILMRGEKARALIARSLLDPRVKHYPGSWIDAAKDLTAHIFSPQTEWNATYLQDLMPLRDGLLDLIEEGTVESQMDGKDGPNGAWVIELSLVRMLVEMNDVKSSYAGLRPRVSGNKVLWTREETFLDSKCREHLYHFDFKTIDSLRAEANDGMLEDATAQSKEEAEVKSLQEEESEILSKLSDSTPKSLLSSSVPLSGYEQLFGDLALTIRQSRSESSVKEENSGAHDSSRSEETNNYEMKIEELMRSTLVPVSKSTYATIDEPISLLDFDETYGIDDVLQIRIQLDEQETKLEFLAEKLSQLKLDEEELLEEQNRTTQLLEECHQRQSQLKRRHEDRYGHPKGGLSQARALLLRICELEERVLCREVEVQQLNMEITAFKLEADDRIEGLVEYQTVNTFDSYDLY